MWGWGWGAERADGRRKRSIVFNAPRKLAIWRTAKFCERQRRLTSSCPPVKVKSWNWVAKGKSNSVIADIIGISPNTVDTYLRRIFEKLEVSDRVTAALRGLAIGLID